MAWMTRKQVRSQPVQSYAEQELQRLLAAYDKRIGQLNDEYLRRMGEHIRDIGTLWPSDVHRLQQIRRMNKNLRQIESRIASAAGKTDDEIRKVFQRIAEEDVRMATKILGVPDTVNVKDNLPLQRILEAQARETAGRMANLSNTTVVSSYYRKAIDEACTAVQSSVEDYNTAIRRVVRDAGQHGLRVTEDGVRKVDYESGWSRRLDSAARMNVLDGVRHLNQSIMEEVGRQFGANGVEIDAHMLCAEDHLPYQGGQYSIEEFEEIQDSLDRPFGEWNCRHSWHGIILGVSPSAWTPDQLEEMRRYSSEKITVDGRTKNRYQWSQEMRRIETAVRQQKDAANLARTTGDDSLRRHCQETILELNRYYEELSDKVGIGPEFQRTYVPGFRDVKVLTSNTNGGTINTKLNASNSVMNPMDANRFYRMRDSLQKQGVSVIQADDDDLRYLQALGAEASYGNGYIMHQGKIPSASAMFEEIIHMKQARVYGEFTDNNPVELAARECAAQHKLLINGKAYGFTEQDFNDIQTNSRKWTERFHSLTGKEYDPNDRDSQYYRGF